jgi:hypothetical protein
MALIWHSLLHNAQELQLCCTPSTEAPGILLTHPNTRPTGQSVLQKGRYKTIELVRTTATNTQPIEYSE